MPTSGANVTVVGRLTKDPEFKQAENGKGVQMRLNVAQNWRDYRGQDGSAFYSATVWMKQETYNSWAYNMFMNSKGKIVTVMGELRPTPSTGQQGQQLNLYINNAAVYPSWKNETQGQPYKPVAQQQQGPVHTFADPAAQQVPVQAQPQAPVFAPAPVQQQQQAPVPAPAQQIVPAPVTTGGILPPPPPTPGGMGTTFPPAPGE